MHVASSMGWKKRKPQSPEVQSNNSPLPGTPPIPVEQVATNDLGPITLEEAQKKAAQQRAAQEAKEKAEREAVEKARKEAEEALAKERAHSTN